MAGVRQTWDLDDFGSGIDRRDGQWSRSQSRWRDLKNCRTTKGRKPNRRVPVGKLNVTLDADCQGFTAVDGVYYVFAKRGDAILHTGTDAAQIQTLYFDNPDLCTTWTLGEFQVFDGYAEAWIIHDFPSATYPKIAIKHVWDGLVYAPTYVQDPYLPGSFSPSIADLPDQVYDSTFRPVLGVGASKSWTSTVRGNAHASRTADARVYNQRSLEGLKEDGEQYCFVVPEGAGVTRRYLVPRNAADLTLDARWAYYVLEKAVGSAWVPMTEVSIAPIVDDTWRPVSVVSRFAGGWNEIAIDVRWGSSAAGLIRFRLVAGAAGVDITNLTNPTVTVKASTAAAWKLGVTSASWRHRAGDGQTTAEHDTADLVAGKTYLLGVTSDSVGFPELVDITTAFPNGWEREHRAFFKKIVVPTAATGSTVANAAWATFSALTGTVQVTLGANGIAGTGTNFDPEITIGDVVRVNGEVATIATRTNDTTATRTGTWAASAGPGVTIERQVPHYALFTAGDTQVSVNLLTLVVGNNLRINARDYVVKEVVSPGVYKITFGGASGDYVSFLDAVYTAYLADVPVVTNYLYAFESDADNAWYTGLVAEYVDLAGAEDALSIATAANDNTGGKITSISSVRNRMLITYAGSMQLWAIDQDTNRTTYLDQLSFGTGDQSRPSPVPFYGSIVVPTLAGFRSISVVGANTDNLQDTNLGEPVASLPSLVARSASFWPYFGQYIVAGIREGSLVFQALDYSREAKITAWATWDNPTWATAGMADIDAGTLVANGNRLLWRAGTSIHHFDAAATLFRDWCDTAGAAYESFGRFHYNDMGKPGQGKRFVSFDIVQQGSCDIGFEVPPYGAYEDTGPQLSGPRVVGTTYGRTRLPIAITGPAIAPTFSSRDEAGWELQRVAIDFLLLRR